MYKSKKNKRFIDKKLKSTGILMTLLPLAACGGSSGGGGAAPAPVPAPKPAEFIESPTNVFIARDDRDTDLDQSAATNDLTVTGKGGDDVIKTGSGADTIEGGGGNDLIRSGDGIDTVSGGAGNDAIVIIGTTTAGQYTNTDITNADGAGTNLSSLITLADLNGRAVSEVEAGEVIDGGTGTNTLYIYGTVDLTGVTLNNLTILEVHSDVTLTPEQLALFTIVDGDGNSVINIQIPPGSTDNYILDLSALDMSQISGINIDGDITIIIDSETDVSGVGTIAVGAGDALTLEINGNGSDTVVDLGALGGTFSQIDVIDLDEDVTIKVDDASDITNLGLTDITGNGEIETDGSGAVDTAIDGLNVASTINTIPTVVNDTATASENQTISVDVLGNDSDRDNDTLTLSNVSGAENKGNLSIVSNEVRFNPGTDFDNLANGETEQVIITYTVSDGEDTEQGQLTITVTGTNDAPVAVADSGTVTENQTKSFDVTENDIDPDSDLTITNVSVTSGQGSVSIVSGEVEFNPGTDFDDLEAGETEQVLIDYTISDGVATDDSVLSVTVTGINDAPIASNDTDSAGENEIITTDVHDNDSDVENDTLTLSAVSVGVGQGSVSIVGNQIKFDPGSDFDDLDDGDSEDVIISYTVSDGDKSDTATLTITVSGSNDAPSAADDSGETTENTSKSFDVLANDTDPDDALTITAASVGAGQGSVSIVDGKILFNPGTDFDDLATGATEDVSVSYTASDSTTSDDGVLTITVTGINDAPIAINDTADANENQTITIDALANDTDEENDSLTITAVSVDAGNGSVSIVSNQIRFDPGTDFDNLAQGATEDIVITYTISDGESSDEASVTLTVTGINDAPITVNDSDEIFNNETTTIDVLLNDSDEENDTLSLTGVSGPGGKGSVSIVDGEVFFDPGSDFDGLAPAATEDVEITYTVFDGNSSSDGTLTITVVGPNDAPVTVNDTANAGENETVLINVLSNDSDTDGQTLTISAVSGPDGKGTVSVVDGKVQFDPGYDFDHLTTGQTEDVVITYTAYDGIDSTDGTLTITINGDEDEPVAVDDEAAVIEGKYLTIDVVANDYDAEGDITLTSVSSEIGSVSIYDNKITYDTRDYFDYLAYGETAEFDITYTISSGNGTATATVTVTVIGRNDAPEALSDTADIGEDDKITIDVLANDTDPNGNTLHIYTASIDGNYSGNLTVVNDQLVFDTAGDFNYLDNGETREVEIDYQVIDGFGAIDTATVRITINGSDDTESISIINYFDDHNDQYYPNNDVVGTFKNIYLNRDTFISGWNQNDTLILGSGDDIVDGYAGADYLDGGLGFDFLSYYWSNNGVTVNLLTGQASGGFATGDVFNNFEGIIGSEYSDSLTGDNYSNSLFGEEGDDFIFGLLGNDSIEGGIGADFLNGGDGIDSLIYATSTSGVNINLLTGIVSGGHADGDTIFGFEDIYGSAYNDILTGDDGDNYLYGGEGYDILSGGGGNDTFFSVQTEGSEQDQFNGGDGFDTIIFYGDYGNSDQPRYHISLSELDATNIEVINLYSSTYKEVVNFSAQDVIDVTDENNTLIIFGGSNDSFQSYSDWTYVGDYFDGFFYYSAFTSGAATILTYHTIPEEGMFNPITTTFYETITNTWHQADFEPATLDFSDSTEDLTVYANEFGYKSATITTGSGNDIVYINDRSGPDYIDTGSGDDLIYLDFYDFVDGGEGNDTISYQPGGGGNGSAASVDLENSNNFKLLNIENIIGSGADDNLKGDDGINIIEGRAGDDVIYSTSGADILDGGEGQDTISFRYSTAAVTVSILDQSGSGGFATETTFSNFEYLSGSDFADTLTGDNNENEIKGRDGNDVIYGLDGADYLHGYSDDDTIYGGEGNDRIYGGFGNDTLNGGEGHDRIYGTNGNNATEDDDDIINGNAGNDTLYGERGNDTINGGEGSDHIEGGSGIDVINGDDDNDYVNGGLGNDILNGGAGIDTVIGGDGDDIIYAAIENDLDNMYGNDGNDEIFIYDANDIVDGGDDIDTLRVDIYFSNTLDLSDISVTNMEKINDVANNLDFLTFTIQDILDITDSNNIIQLDGSDYSVTSTGEGWLQGADQVISTETYHTYTAGGATLLIDTDLTQDIT